MFNQMLYLSKIIVEAASASAFEVGSCTVGISQSTRSDFVLLVKPDCYIKADHFLISLQGSFDRIVSGANCTEEDLHIIQKLLKPGSGLLLTPISFGDHGGRLMLYKRLLGINEGHLNMESHSISMVQFSDLRVSLSFLMAQLSD